ncbi:TPA: SIR2 family protein [Pseudomonas aeruginosa]|uniref:SIR2 family protein n=1 Tax=Pseudomonas aeruginosa TaxID=287 RepID=UPI00068AD67E|nr:SIR2 family protein [Pseudomonas aeruginosa]
MHSLLLGNGVNRAALQKDWNQLLRELAHEFDADDLAVQLDAKPLSMLIEELCARQSGPFHKSERAIKVAFARLLKQIEPKEAHRRICAPFRVIMTTNYDFTIEDALAGPLHRPSFLAQETRYSLFRRHQAAECDVWHVHGDVGRPDSMVLGYDHYAGSLQKIRNYVMDGIKIGKLPRRVSTAMKGGNLDFTSNRKIYSWVDFFLRDHVHIVGLGLDFTEIDLWWLLLHKRRRIQQTGRVFYYQVSVGKPPSETPVTSLLRSLNAEIVPVIAGTYEDCYLRAADEIEKRIREMPDLFAISPRSCYELSWQMPEVKELPKQARIRFAKPSAVPGA